MRRLTLVGIAALVVLGAGCSSGGSAKSTGTNATTSTSTQTTVASTTTTQRRNNNAAYKALAQRAVLKLSDFPPGWTSAPSKDDNSNAIDKQLSQCFHIQGLKLIPNATNVDSDDFTSPSEQTVTNTVSVTATASEIGKAFDVLSGPNAPKCFTDAFNAGIQENLKSSSTTLPNGTTIGSASVNPLSFNALGDRTIAYRASIPVSAKGFDTAVYLDFILVQHGRFAVVLSGEDTITPFPTDMSESLIRKVLARLPH